MCTRRGILAPMLDDEDSGAGAAKSLLAGPVDTSRLAIARSLADAAPG